MPDYVELTPEQAKLLWNGYVAESNRARHADEPWLSQAARDAASRDEYIEQAINAGVPREQAVRFVYFFLLGQGRNPVSEPMVAAQAILDRMDP